MKIGIDVFGGDNMPKAPIEGAIDAMKDLDVEIHLYGKKDEIKNELNNLDYNKDKIKIIDCKEVVKSDDNAIMAIRRKKESSMVKGLIDLKEKKIDGFISAGNTGALLTGGLLLVGRIKGIDRPCLTTVYPTENGMCVLCDVGANAECKPLNIFEFSIMGSLYAEKILGIENPKVGLINIGVEENKGTPMMIESYNLLKESDINFIGNVEARDIPMKQADVLVTDGFTGNIVLKLSEGLFKSMTNQIKTEVMKKTSTKIGGALIKPALKGVKKNLDYTEYGGAPLLGVNRPVIKAHGSSNKKAFSSAIKYAYKYISEDIIGEISNKL